MGSLIAKTDIKDTFRTIQVNPKDYHLLGFISKVSSTSNDVCQWGPVAPVKYLRSTALQWVMLDKLEAGGMSHMLDDFFFIGPPQSEK